MLKLGNNYELLAKLIKHSTLETDKSFLGDFFPVLQPQKVLNCNKIKEILDIKICLI